MSERAAQPAPGSGIEQILSPHMRAITDTVSVARMLPAIERRAVGPFVFLDQMGPTVFPPGTDVDVRPHPHIGLATVTYLFEGEIVHRDSLGSVQSIRPGDVNWMSAGRGIVHSERAPPELRGKPIPMNGLQFWVGLPRAQEETAPAFAHYPVQSLPMTEVEGVRLRLVVGTLLGRRSPVVTAGETVLADFDLTPASRFVVPTEHRQRAILVLLGPAYFAGLRIEAPSLVVLEEGAPVMLTADDEARCVLFGGDPLDGPRHMWWNFVSSSRERIERAKADWKEGRFAPIPGETEFIPLPE